MAIVDTSFLIARTEARDRFHEAAKSVSLVGEPFSVPAEVWTEFAQFLLRRARPAEAQVILRAVLDTPLAIRHVTSPEDYVAWIANSGIAQTKMRTLGRPPLSLVDLIVCGLAQRYREAVLTFDEGIRAAIQARLFPGARVMLAG